MFIRVKTNKKGEIMVMGHCMKCKDKKEIKNAVMNKTAKGIHMAKGTCVKCGTTVCAILGKDDAEKAMKAGQAKKNF
jgi:hypothetical protein